MNKKTKVYRVYRKTSNIKKYKTSDAVVTWLDQKLGRTICCNLLMNWNEDYYNETLNEVVMDAIITVYTQSKVHLGVYEIADLLDLDPQFVQSVINSYS